MDFRRDPPPEEVTAAVGSTSDAAEGGEGRKQRLWLWRTGCRCLQSGEGRILGRWISAPATSSVLFLWGIAMAEMMADVDVGFWPFWDGKIEKRIFHAQAIGNQNNLNLLPLLVGNVGLIFTKGDLKEVSEEVAKYKILCPRKTMWTLVVFV